MQCSRFRIAFATLGGLLIAISHWSTTSIFAIPPNNLVNPTSATPNTSPRGSARSSSVSSDCWIDHFIDEVNNNLHPTTAMSHIRWRDIRTPRSPTDIEAQPQMTLTEAPAAELHPAVAPTVPPPPVQSPKMPPTNKVDYEAGLRWTKNDKRAMSIVFLCVLTFTIIIVIVMAVSGANSRGQPRWLDEGKENITTLPATSIPLPSSTVDSDGAHLLSMPDTSLLATMRCSTTSNPRALSSTLTKIFSSGTRDSASTATATNSITAGPSTTSATQQVSQSATDSQSSTLPVASTRGAAIDDPSTGWGGSLVQSAWPALTTIETTLRAQSTAISNPAPMPPASLKALFAGSGPANYQSCQASRCCG